jgi:hypothetical protein
MKEMSKKGDKFYTQWKERRKKKWLYIFLNGSIYWGLTIAIVLFLWDSQFKVENMQLSRFISSIIIFGIVGLFIGFNQYKRIDKIYLSLRDDNDILKGIDTLKLGKVWNYENLIIKKLDDGTLLIKNELFWFADSEVLTEKLNECFNLVMSDFQRIQKNTDFNEFSKNSTIRIQIFDNSESESPLIDKIFIKNNAL